jgi:hypothetical protein
MVSIVIDGSVSIAVTPKLTANKTKHKNEKSKVLRVTNPLEVNKKADINKSIPKILVRNWKT